jgi:hypothetical protein
MVEEGFLRACLLAVGGVELLFLASFSSCSFQMAEGFSRDFLLILGFETEQWKEFIKTGGNRASLIC